MSETRPTPHMYAFRHKNNDNPEESGKWLGIRKVERSASFRVSLTMNRTETVLTFTNKDHAIKLLTDGNTSENPVITIEDQTISWKGMTRSEYEIVNLKTGSVVPVTYPKDSPDIEEAEVDEDEDSPTPVRNTSEKVITFTRTFVAEKRENGDSFEQTFETDDVIPYISKLPEGGVTIWVHFDGRDAKTKVEVPVEYFELGRNPE